MSDKRPSLQEKADEADERLRSHIREANEAVADLRAVLREVKAYAPALVREMIQKEVTRQVDDLGKEMGKATEQITAAIFKKFDDLTATMLGETGSRNDKNKASIPELIETLAEIRRHGGGNA